MKKTFVLTPRKTGKTKLAKYEYLKDPRKTIYVAYNVETANSIASEINSNNFTNFISPNKLEKTINGDDKNKNIILDEYLMFDSMFEVNQVINKFSYKINNLYIFSSLHKKYSRVLFEFVYHNKKSNCSFDDLLLIYLKKLNYISKDTYINLFELYHNFLTDSNTYLIPINSNGVCELNDIIPINKFNIQL